MASFSLTLAPQFKTDCYLTEDKNNSKQKEESFFDSNPTFWHSYINFEKALPNVKVLLGNEVHSITFLQNGKSILFPITIDWTDPRSFETFECKLVPHSDNQTQVTLTCKMPLSWIVGNALDSLKKKGFSLENKALCLGTVLQAPPHDKEINISELFNFSLKVGLIPSKSSSYFSQIDENENRSLTEKPKITVTAKRGAFTCLRYPLNYHPSKSPVNIDPPKKIVDAKKNDHLFVFFRSKQFLSEIAPLAEVKAAASEDELPTETDDIHTRKRSRKQPPPHRSISRGDEDCFFKFIP